MNLSENIRFYRTHAGISQAKLGELLNVTQQAVAKWEKGISEPDSAALNFMANLFKISADDLLGRDITNDERAAGASPIKKISITPIEDDLLNIFREIGKKYGDPGQHAALSTLENMLKLK